MSDPLLPQQKSPAVDVSGPNAGLMRPEWYRQLSLVIHGLRDSARRVAVVTEAVSDGSGNVVNIAAAIAGKQDASADLDSINLLYGAGMVSRSELGEWSARLIDGTARITVTNNDGVVGNPTVDLSLVTDAGGGTLQKTAFDTYGRKTGTSAATTTDLPEGTNLYFTNARAVAAVSAGSTTFNLIDGNGDIRVDGQGNLRITI